MERAIFSRALRTSGVSQCAVGLRTTRSCVRSTSTFSVVRKLDAGDVTRFCELVGDSNPIHRCSPSAPRESSSIVPGMLVMSLVSGLVGTRFPGSVLVDKTASFQAPLRVGHSVDVRVVAGGERKLTNLDYECKCVETGESVLVGRIRVRLPSSR